MAGVSDKARFYLEQSVPQLQEFEQKKIFSKDEIRTFVKKRSEFEHRVLARGSKPAEFARYAAWEINLEHLRQKRCKRLRIKDNLRYAGPARIYQVLDRGTKKHPGDVALWMSYLECTRKAKATKKFNEVMTAALRLHPTKAELWLYAARWTLEQDADMTGARSYMQRGTRFCIQSKELWIEYAKLEMIYLAKIAMRRRILGLDVDTTVIEEEEEDDGADPFAEGNDMIAIPDIKTNAIRPNMIRKVQVDVEASKDPMNTPALNGAIPLAIYDAAKKQPFFCAEAAESFFNMFSVFTQVRSLPYILQHVLDSMEKVYPADACTQSCCLRQPIVMIVPTSAEFPGALAISLERLQEATNKVKDKAVLARKVKGWIQPIISIDNLDPGVAKVLEHMLRRLE